MTDLFVLTQEALAGMEVELVDVERAALGLLRVTIDCPSGVTIEHCHHVSNQLSRVYEVENVDYKRLEVGSPGVDRALRNESEFRRFLGERVEIKLRRADAEGRRVFSGRLIEISPPAVHAVRCGHHQVGKSISATQLSLEAVTEIDETFFLCNAKWI